MPVLGATLLLRRAASLQLDDCQAKYRNYKAFAPGIPNNDGVLRKHSKQGVMMKLLSYEGQQTNVSLSDHTSFDVCRALYMVSDGTLLKQHFTIQVSDCTQCISIYNHMEYYLQCKTFIVNRIVVTKEHSSIVLPLTAEFLSLVSTVLAMNKLFAKDIDLYCITFILLFLNLFYFYLLSRYSNDYCLSRRQDPLQHMPN